VVLGGVAVRIEAQVAKLALLPALGLTRRALEGFARCRDRDAMGAQLGQPGLFDERVQRAVVSGERPDVAACLRDRCDRGAGSLCYDRSMPGLGELIVVLAILFLGVWATYRAFTRTTWIERLVLRMTAHRFSALPYLHAEAATRRSARLIRLPLSLVALFLVALGIIVMAAVINIDYGGSIFAYAFLLLFGVSILLMITTVIVHWSSSSISRRQAKYELMITSLGLNLMSGVLAASPAWQTSGAALDIPAGEMTTFLQWQTASYLLIVPIFTLVVGFAARRIARRVSSGKSSYRRAVRLHRWVTPLGKLALLFSMSPLNMTLIPSPIVSLVIFLFLFVYILIRFELKDILLTHPILYLRSFHSDAALLAFSKIVVPVAGRYGALTGLVHSTQPVYVLQRSVATLDRGSFVEAPDDRWREWVSRALATCHLVVIDVSNLTESVQWELRAAMNQPGHQRTLLIEQRDEPTEREQYPHRIFYSRDKKSRKLTRRALDGWFSQAIEADPSLLVAERSGSLADREVSPGGRV
jgi:hypothetical protein